MRKLHHCPPIDILQKWFSIGIILHPRLAKQFDQQLVELVYKDKVCLMPKERLERFSKHH